MLLFKLEIVVVALNDAWQALLLSLCRIMSDGQSACCIQMVRT